MNEDDEGTNVSSFPSRRGGRLGGSSVRVGGARRLHAKPLQSHLVGNGPLETRAYDSVDQEETSKFSEKEVTSSKRCFEKIK